VFGDSGIFHFWSKMGQKQAQNKYRVKPTVGYRFGKLSDRMEASMRTEDRRLRMEDGVAAIPAVRGAKPGGKMPALYDRRDARRYECAAMCRLMPDIAGRERWGKAPSRGTLPAQSMTGWAGLKDGRGLARWYPGLCIGLPGRTRPNSLKLP
jgi:hypothetical protein